MNAIQGARTCSTASAGVRLPRSRRQEERPMSTSHGPSRRWRPAVHLGSDQQDRQRAEGSDRRRHHAGLHVESWSSAQRRFRSTGTQQADPAAEHVAGGEGDDRGGATGGSCDGGGAAEAVPRRLPDERRAITHKFDIGGHEGYVTVGLFEDGSPGEVFLVMAKEGSTISGFADAFAQAIPTRCSTAFPCRCSSTSSATRVSSRRE